MKALALLAVLASGCGLPALVDDLVHYDDLPSNVSYTPIAGQVEAIRAAMDVYGMRDPAPSIAWVEDLSGCNEYGYKANGICVRGSYTERHKNVYLARVYDDFLPYALAHEIAHVAGYRTTGKASHDEPWFIEGDAYRPNDKIIEATAKIAAIIGL
ncbi:MAG: hypothetical protein M3Q00_01295 [Pseudomonadota bacterium]|nr:hypothetical protein [Pseudomonadota bacterium]